MKKVLKIIGFGLLGLILVAFGGLYIAYHTFSPGDKGIPVNEENLVYFQESYDDCRNAFLAEADNVLAKFNQGRLFSVRVPSKVDQELFTDFIYIPPLADTTKLLVLSSAVHGIEGYAGSAVQQMFLKEMVNEDLLNKMGILIIHAVNPYGFKYGRRVTENNVDLNRNSEVNPALFQTKNDGYLTLIDMLNPEGEVSEGNLRSQFFYLIAISKMLKESMSVLRQAVLQGQYEIPDGIYFGGTDFEPQIDSMTAILPGIFKPYEQILEIDLHTGYGARRVLHLFSNPVDDPEIKAKTEAIFTGHPIDWGDKADFYVISGGFASSYLGKLNPEAEYLNMAFEWGTFDSQKTLGSLQSISRVINENQGIHYGYKNERQEKKVKLSSKEMYYSDSGAWRSEVIRSGREMLKLVVITFPDVEIPVIHSSSFKIN